MNFHRRRGGTVVNIIVAGFILFLAVSALYYQARSLGLFSGGTATTSTNAITLVTGITTVTYNGTVTSITTTAFQPSDNVSLAQLQSLSFANSTKCDGYLDAGFWDIAMRASGKTTMAIIPNTVYGLSQTWSEWTNFFRTNMNNPPAWITLGLGNYTTAFETQLAARVMGTHDAKKAAAVMQNYTSYIGGLGATGLDFLSWGGLSALKVYYETGSITQAAAQTFPAQLYQLFALSQDCGYSEEQRAQFLGTAMSMTAFILATSGKDGFGPQFEGLLERLGLSEAWAGMKRYVKDIADASPRAAYQTVVVLSALAKKFPSDQFPDLTSYTSSRIANMVQVLKDKGFSADEISQKVTSLGQAVHESGDEGHLADVADAASYQVEGFMRVKIDSDLRPAVFSESAHDIRAAFLALILPDFKPGEVTALKVTVHKLWMELPSFHVYEGGKYVRFELPIEEVQPGDDVGLSFEVLSVEDFASSIPQIVLSNTAHRWWTADAATLKDFKVVDGVLQFSVLQDNRWWSGGEFTIQGQVVDFPRVSTNGGIYAEFAIKDYAGRTRDLRLRYNGFSFGGAALQLVEGVNSNPISLISFDGYRLQFVYRSDNRVATIYLEPPSEAIYGESAMHPYSGPYLELVQGKYTRAWQIDNVVLVRDLERAMLKGGGTYDLGRIGSEIAYVAGDKQLGLKNLIIEEPSQGGRDLYTLDDVVAIQARFLKNLGTDKVTTLQNALFDLADKLQQDYEHQRPQMQDGYAILSYVDTDGTIKTIILEVPKW